MIQKRYQHYAKEGIVWTEWFKISDNAPMEPWQLKNKLKNEYREVAEDGTSTPIKISYSTPTKTKTKTK